jgi:hypothetical protein
VPGLPQAAEGATHLPLSRLDLERQPARRRAGVGSDGGKDAIVDVGHG